MYKEILVAVMASVLTAGLLWLFGALGKLPNVLFVPSGAVVSFDLDECPPVGWDEYRQAYGRFVRGIDKSGDGIDPGGVRTPGSLQDDEVRSHSHGTVIMIRDDLTDGVDSHTTRSGEHHNEERRTENEGGEESRPKNVALLYCEKQ